MGLECIENLLSRFGFRLQQLEFNEEQEIMKDFTLTTIPVYWAGRPYRRTLSTNSRSTLRCTKTWNDSEKLTRDRRKSSVCIPI